MLIKNSFCYEIIYQLLKEKYSPQKKIILKYLENPVKKLQQHKGTKYGKFEVCIRCAVDITIQMAHSKEDTDSFCIDSCCHWPPERVLLPSCQLHNKACGHYTLNSIYALDTGTTDTAQMVQAWSCTICTLILDTEVIAVIAQGTSRHQQHDYSK